MFRINSKSEISIQSMPCGHTKAQMGPCIELVQNIICTFGPRVTCLFSGYKLSSGSLHVIGPQKLIKSGIIRRYGL